MVVTLALLGNHTSHSKNKFFFAWLNNILICIFGSPKGVLTDQGTNLLSNLLRRLAKRFRIRQFKPTSFRSQSNESLERSHHVLAEYLKQFVYKNAEWDDWLELATFPFHTSIHEGTKCTP